MSVNYTSVIGVGVEEDEITYRSLTEQSKNIIKAVYLDSLSEEETYDENGYRLTDKHLLDVVDLISDSDDAAKRLSQSFFDADKRALLSFFLKIGADAIFLGESLTDNEIRDSL